jgi:hypothetical protein
LDALPFLGDVVGIEHPDGEGIGDDAAANLVFEA